MAMAGQVGGDLWCLTSAWLENQHRVGLGGTIASHPRVSQGPPNGSRSSGPSSRSAAGWALPDLI